MKKIFLLVLGLLVGECAFAQKGQKTLGLQINGFVLEGVFKDGFIKGTGGVYFDYTLSRRWGIYTSVLYGRDEGDGYYNNCSGLCPGFSIPITYRLHFVDVPVNFAVNLNRRENTSWKTNFLFGYTLRYLASRKYWETQNGKKVEELDSKIETRSKHFSNIGFEVKHNFGQKYNLALNPGLSIEIGDRTPASYLFFNLKFGRNL